jgi:hypothetical protein
MQIDKVGLKDLLLGFFKKVPDSGIAEIGHLTRRSLLADDVYSPVAFSTVKSIVETNPLLFHFPAPVHGAQIADCDDYAMLVKSLVTSHVRQKYASTGNYQAPPAIGVVFSRSHVVNIMVGKDAQHKLTVKVFDVSNPQVPFINTLTEDPVEAAALFGTLPLRWIYI